VIKARLDSLETKARAESPAFQANMASTAFPEIWAKREIAVEKAAMVHRVFVVSPGDQAGKEIAVSKATRVLKVSADQMVSDPIGQVQKASPATQVDLAAMADLDLLAIRAFVVLLGIVVLTAHPVMTVHQVSQVSQGEIHDTKVHRDPKAEKD